MAYGEKVKTMKSIQKEQILRLNCPGFGEESFLTIGQAKPLDNYDVIIANPVSILHLFDREPDVLKEIDAKLDEGLTSYTIKNDGLLQSLESDLKKRIFELVSFLERGGLLVYYLCRPFLMQGSSLSMDNYFWLESLAPDTPVENNVRHMSAVSHGRTIEPTEQAEKSEFAAYFQQTGLEWNTIIRTDFLTEGYIVLATAGPRKCIAAHLIAGDNGGRIIFLPAPYSPDFDRTLMDCINNWYAKRGGEAVEAPAAVGAAVGDASAKFPQPDPAAFLKPEPSLSGAESTQSPPPTRPSSSRTGMTPQIASTSRTGLPSQNPSTSRTGLPPVQKFDSRVSRSQPQSDSDSAKKKMSAEEILESVSAQAGQAANDPTGEPAPFNERATSEIGTAFNSLNQPLPQQNPDGPGVPSAADLLKELESVGSKPSAQSGPAQKQEPAKVGGEANSRNLLKEMENLATPADKKQQGEPAQSGNAESTDFTDYKFGVDEQKTAAAGYQYGVDGSQPKSEKQAPPPAKAEQQKPSDSFYPQAEPKQPEAKQEHGNNNHEAEAPEPKELIKKMEETMTKSGAPDWCAEYTFPDLEELKREKASLAETIRQTQAKITSIENKVAQLEGLKNALLASDGEELLSACSRVFKRLGWTPKNSDVANEILLSTEKPEVIARVVRTNSQPKSSDVAQLAQSVITFWGEHEVEPKGLLVTCTWANRPPSQRNEPDYTEGLADFAQKKNLCLMTTMQLLCMYRDLELGKVSNEEMRRRIIETNGRLPGFSLEAMTKATAG